MRQSWLFEKIRQIILGVEDVGHEMAGMHEDCDGTVHNFNSESDDIQVLLDATASRQLDVRNSLTAVCARPN